MISKNAVQILEKQLYQPISLRVQQNCLQILRNISDQAVKLVRREKKNFHFNSISLTILFF
jgi:hypothetical protein